jgi:hypothetical protein
VFADFDDDELSRKKKPVVSKQPNTPMPVSRNQVGKPVPNREKERETQHHTRARDLERQREAQSLQQQKEETQAKDGKEIANVKEETNSALSQSVGDATATDAINAIEAIEGKVGNREEASIERGDCEEGIGSNENDEDPAKSSIESVQHGVQEDEYEVSSAVESLEEEEEDQDGEGIEEGSDVRAREEDHPDSHRHAATTNPMDAIKQLGGGLFESFIPTLNATNQSNASQIQMKDFIGREQYNLYVFFF